MKSATKKETLKERLTLNRNQNDLLTQKKNLTPILMDKLIDIDIKGSPHTYAACATVNHVRIKQTSRHYTATKHVNSTLFTCNDQSCVIVDDFNPEDVVLVLYRLQKVKLKTEGQCLSKNWFIESIQKH